MTNGLSVPFHSGSKTATLVEAAVMSRGSYKARERFDEMMESCPDSEMKEVYACYASARKEEE
jgi:hypothetical protein